MQTTATNDDLHAVLTAIGETPTTVAGLLTGLDEDAIGYAPPDGQSCRALIGALVASSLQLGKVAHDVLGHVPGAGAARPGDMTPPTGAMLQTQLRFLREHIVSTVEQQGAGVWSSPTPAGRPLFAYAVDLRESDTAMLCGVAPGSGSGPLRASRGIRRLVGLDDHLPRRRRAMGSYRSDVVGSLLRPDYLKEARARHEAGEIDDAAFKQIEDRAVDEAIALQEAAGLDVVTDGEMRRYAFYGHFIDAIEGFDKFGGWAIPFHDEQGNEMSSSGPVVVSRLQAAAATCARRSSPICAPARTARPK